MAAVSSSTARVAVWGKVEEAAKGEEAEAVAAEVVVDEATKKEKAALEEEEEEKKEEKEELTALEAFAIAHDPARCESPAVTTP